MAPFADGMADDRGDRCSRQRSEAVFRSCESVSAIGISRQLTNATALPMKTRPSLSMSGTAPKNHLDLYLNSNWFAALHLDPADETFREYERVVDPKYQEIRAQAKEFSTKLLSRQSRVAECAIRKFKNGRNTIKPRTLRKLTKAIHDLQSKEMRN
jgi:hypothetical protein